MKKNLLTIALLAGGLFVLWLLFPILTVLIVLFIICTIPQYLMMRWLTKRIIKKEVSQREEVLRRNDNGERMRKGTK